MTRSWLIFRKRYFAGGALTHHFQFLDLRKSDHPDLVRAVIEGANNDPRDRMLALLMIVWRLRNNLFHGAKWAYELRDQQQNFARANSVLMRMLERHGQLGRALICAEPDFRKSTKGLPSIIGLIGLLGHLLPIV